MIVDDALVVRGFVKRWVDAEPDLELVGSLRDGAKRSRSSRKSIRMSWSSMSKCPISTASPRCRSFCKRSLISQLSWRRR
jgi:hypothetical protein